MAAAAVPALIKVGAMVGGSLLGKKLSGPSKTQQTAMTQTQQAGANLTSAAAPLMASGATNTQAAGDYLRGGGNYLGSAGNYYKNILSGNRSAMANAVAPEMTGIMDYYKGAAGKADRNLRGGSRDYALAELDREKVGKMAGVLPQARAGAATGATQIGNSLSNIGTSFGNIGLGQTQAGGNMLANGAYVSNGLFNQGTTVGNQQQDSGKNYGGMIFDILNSMPFGKKPAAPFGTYSVTD